MVYVSISYNEVEVSTRTGIVIWSGGSASSMTLYIPCAVSPSQHNVTLIPPVPIAPFVMTDYEQRRYTIM